MSNDLDSLQRELRTLSAQLSAAEQAAGLGSWRWDIPSNRVTWSEELYRIYGLEPNSEELTFERYLAKVHPDDRERCRQLVEAALHKRSPFSFEERILRPDGSERRLLSRGSVQCNRNGEPESMLGICMDITDRRAGEELLDFLTHCDPVTGLINRFVLKDRAETALQRAKRHDLPLGLLLVDLDQFKSINDSLGYPTGDRVLQIVGRRLQQILRSTDTVSRTGDDEFVIILEELKHPDDLSGVADKVLSTIAEPIHIKEHRFELSASIGIAYYPENGHDVIALLKNADAAMYRAKSRGLNQVEFYSSEIGKAADETLKIVSGLQQAVDRNQLFLCYQPCLDLRSGVVTAVEALVRWRHPELGVLAPSRFIAHAEASNRIGSIGEWVLQTALEEMMRWRNRGLPQLRLAINVSNKQLRNSTFGNRVVEMLREIGFPATDLELEFTESSIVDDYEAVAKVISFLRNHGIMMSIDDFGSGYSSLAQFKQLPIDRIKIDRSLVEDLPENTESQTIVRAIVAMAEQLGLAITVEGIETAEQLEWLKAIGCNEAQGFYLAKPLEADELLARLKHQTGHFYLPITQTTGSNPATS